MTKIDLQNAPQPELFRVTAPKQPTGEISKHGGDYGGGLIRGFAAITRGEALGHNLWIDDQFLAQLEAALINAGETGLKSRFTHPDMSSDGLAKYLGRAKTGRLDGQRVLTDLHLAKSAHKSPDGDLAGYILARTAEDPASFGASIVFYRDQDAEAAFLLEHGAKLDNDWLDTSEWQSPDPDNVKNLRHARLATLEAVDLVDSPAANPAGMFHRGPIAELASLTDWALGLRAERPADTCQSLDVDPDRLKAYVERYLANRGLQIVPIKSPADTQPPDGAAAEPAPGLSHGETIPEQTNSPAAPIAAAADRPLTDYCAAFGDGPGARFFLDAVPFATAQAQLTEALRKENEALRAKLSLSEKEHDHPLPLDPKRTLQSHIRIRA